MPGIGGSIVGVNIHGREFSVTADSDSGRKLGGAMNEVQPNGDGTTRIVSIREAWSSGELTLSIDNKVYEQLQKFKKKNPEFNTSYRVEQYLIGEING